MKTHTFHRRLSRIPAALVGPAALGLMLLLHPLPACAEIVPPADLSRAEILELGERMFREGILPSGQAMDTDSPAGAEAASTAFSCSSCHLRAGLGSVEGVVITPPATGAKLYKPYSRPAPVEASGRALSVYSRPVAERPAYDRESLARALRQGIDAGGRALNDVMPRYPLGDRDLAILISYLESLSARPSPGASSTEIAFATIVTDEVSQEDREAMLLPLKAFIAEKNRQMDLFEDFLKFGYSPTVEMKYAFSRASLQVWELKGPPESWRAQLEAYLEKKPVFAVLGGISNQEWRPIHDFCEARRLPCLFPITDLPVVSETGWYTYYFNKGYFQEGEAVARYLNGPQALPAGTPILQIIEESAAGRALAAGFRESWDELERPAPATVTLSAGELRDPAVLEKLLAQHKPGVLLLWADGEVVPQLPALVSRLSGPGEIFLSSTYLGSKTAAIAEGVRDRVYLTYPYRLTPYLGTRDGGYDAKVPILASARPLGERRIISRSTSILRQSIIRALNLLYDNLHRDHLLDILTMQMELTVLDYELLTFGVGQRYASKGCYLIQLGPGEAPPLLPRSEWIVH